MFPTANMDKTSRDRYAQQNVWASVVAQIITFRADAKGRDMPESNNIARQMMMDIAAYAIECKREESDNITIARDLEARGYEAFEDYIKSTDDKLFLLMTRKMVIAELTHISEFSFEPRGTWESISEQTKKE